MPGARGPLRQETLRLVLIVYFELCTFKCYYEETFKTVVDKHTYVRRRVYGKHIAYITYRVNCSKGRNLDKFIFARNMHYGNKDVGFEKYKNYCA